MTDLAMQVALLQKGKCKNANENKCAYSTVMRAAILGLQTYRDTFIYNMQRQPILYRASLSHSAVNFSCFV